MSITISYELANFIMYILGAALIVVIIITFVNVNRFIKRLDKLVEKNEDSINKTASTIPEVVKNVNDVTLGIKQGVDRAGTAIETLETSVCDTVAAVSEGTEGLFDFVSIAGEVIRAVLRIFPMGKKK